MRTVKSLLNQKGNTVWPTAPNTLLARHRVRYLPVLEEGRQVGIISIGAVVQAILADREEALQHLELAVGTAEEIYE